MKDGGRPNTTKREAVIEGEGEKVKNKSMNLFCGCHKVMKTIY